MGPVRTGSLPHDPSWCFKWGAGVLRRLLTPFSPRTCASSLPEPRERGFVFFFVFAAAQTGAVPSSSRRSPPCRETLPRRGCTTVPGSAVTSAPSTWTHSCHRRLLPPASLVAVRIPGAETSPKPQEGEVVVFDEHFYRGFGLPASAFFNNFLTFFGLQPHHLVPNAILQLASFVVLCEGFLGIEPCLDL
ncbi:hypothetical protein D1007_36119 [Hordeum vulgare]|nr:hypothetical protein D1007_36119 [Hordeum vulgare]